MVERRGPLHPWTSTPQVVDLTRVSLSERIASHLRIEILEGRLIPGQRLVEERITSELAVSRNPLREAFRQLSFERLVTNIPGKGAFVTVIDAVAVADIFKARSAIETFALESIAKHGIDDSILEELRANLAATERAVDSSDWDAVSSNSLYFHQLLVEATSSSRLIEYSRSLLAELRLAFHAPHVKERHVAFVDANRILLQSIENSAPDFIELRKYLSDGERFLSDALNSLDSN